MFPKGQYRVVRKIFLFLESVNRCFLNKIFGICTMCTKIFRSIKTKQGIFRLCHIYDATQITSSTTSKNPS